MNTSLGIIACIFYLLAAGKLGILILDHRHLEQQVGSERSKKIQAFIMGTIALICNGALLSNTIFTEHALDLGFSNTWSLISWIIAVFILFTAMSKPLENLLIIFFPLAAFGVLLVLFFPNHRLLAETAVMGLKAHILISILAYSLLMVAMLQAMLLAFQEYQLRHKHPTTMMHILPPMQIMEKFLLQLILGGFFMLSLSLITGFVFIYDIFAQHLIHKTILSLMSWLIFAILLWGRWYFGWRGRRISYWMISGFFTLMLAFLGSKLVLETILMRV